MVLDDEIHQLSEQVGQALKAQGLKLVTAESCTGGLIGGAVTAIPGSSDWFERGFITYTNAAKMEDLGVQSATLRQFGAVSEETAREMVTGALKRSRASVALSVTGVAGPTGGSAQKPVGTVCFAWEFRDVNRVSVTHHLQGDRAAVRRQSVLIALRGVLAVIEVQGSALA